ncbi:hypothetical protein FSP39_016074 [Pinctada imbricata]|uniref:Tetraspanin n=1 Tax=Pinctada imbricata TaxID=66713 RepID=A0AA88Y7M4_PINIB|nr:hypothetical protein FSP39_016074 [Pinctada imbricata]
MGGSKSFLKCGSVIFNLLTFLAGSASLALGIYILVSDYGPKELTGILGNELYHMAAYISIAGGASIAVISLCGCCGAIRESKCVLIIYVVCMSVIFFIILTAAVLTFLFLGQTSSQTRESMKIAVVKNYGVNLDNSQNRMITDVMDFMQKQLKCCGVTGDVNSSDSWAIYKTQTSWFKRNDTEDRQYVPESCCIPNTDVQTCTGVTPYDGPPTAGPPLKGTNRKNPNLYHTGCYDELVHYIQGHALMIGGIAIAAIVVIVKALVQQYNAGSFNHITTDFQPNSYNHVTPETMALTGSSATDTNRREKKKKKEKEKLKLMKKQEKPLRSSRSTPTPNHIEDGYLKHSRDYRIRSTASTVENERSSCFNCLRTALHCYNIVVLILGIGTLGVGVWLLVTDFSVREISVIINSNLFEIGTYLILAGGGLIAILAFCGCCGTMREDRCILGFYGIVLLMVFAALIVSGTLAFTFRDDIQRDIKTKLKDSIAHQYGVEVRTNATNKLVTDAWDSMQRKLECCGAHGNVSDTTSWSIYKSASKWYHHKKEKHPMVPESCCVEGGDKLKCQGNDVTDGPPNWGPAPGFNPKRYINEHLYTTGCYEKMISYIRQYSLILGAVALSVPTFMVIGSIISFCLCCRVKKTDTFDEDL